MAVDEPEDFGILAGIAIVLMILPFIIALAAIAGACWVIGKVSIYLWQHRQEISDWTHDTYYEIKTFLFGGSWKPIAQVRAEDHIDESFCEAKRQLNDAMDQPWRNMAG